MATATAAAAAAATTTTTTTATTPKLPSYQAHFMQGWTAIRVFSLGPRFLSPIATTSPHLSSKGGWCWSPNGGATM